MVELFAFRPSFRLIALAICSAVVAFSASPASARSHHSRAHHIHAQHFAHVATRHVRHYRHRHHQYARYRHHHYRYAHHRHYRQYARVSRWQFGAAQPRPRRFYNMQPNRAPARRSSFAGRVPVASFGGSSLVSEARRYLGGNPTGRGRLWCARFMNMVLQHTGHRGTGSDMASSFARYGQRISGPQVGAIAVMGRRGGGHVGIVTGIDAQGNPIMISGNNGNRVREAPVSRGRIYAYVMPTS